MYVFDLVNTFYTMYYCLLLYYYYKSSTYYAMCIAAMVYSFTSNNCAQRSVKKISKLWGYYLLCITNVLCN